MNEEKEETMSIYENTSEDLENNSHKPRSRSEAKAIAEKSEERYLKRNIVISLVVIGAILLGGGLGVVYELWDREQRAQDNLSSLTENMREVIPINTDVLDYGSDSYALGIDAPDNYPSTGAFIFGAEEGEYAYTVDVFIDYSHTRSRDFFFSNSSMLRGLIEHSEAQVRIHPVPAEHPYAMYAAEAMAQMMHRHPDKAWEANIALLQLTSEVLELESPTPRQMLEMIESEFNRHLDINDITVDVILEGMFTDWISSTSSDERLRVGQYPPLVYSNNQLIDTSTYYDTNTLRENILAPEKQEITEDSTADELEDHDQEIIDQDSDDMENETEENISEEEQEQQEDNNS